MSFYCESNGLSNINNSKKWSLTKTFFLIPTERKPIRKNNYKIPRVHKLNVTPGCKEMKVTWDTLLKDEFDGIQYIIQWRKKGEQKGWRRGESSKQVYIIKNLTPETDYEVKVSALCDKVISPAEQTHACTGTLPTLQEVVHSVLETQMRSCLNIYIYIYIFLFKFKCR